MFPLIRELPKTFWTLETIQSMNVKVKLTQNLVLIYEALAQMEKIQPDLKTKNLVESFLRYVSRSCLNKDTINTRSLWLLRYSLVVRHHLFLFLYPHKEGYFLMASEQGNPILDALIPLIETISHLRKLSPKDDYLIRKELDSLIESAQGLTKEQDEPFYVNEVELLLDLHHSLQDHVKCFVVMDDIRPVHSTLRHINLNLDMYWCYKKHRHNSSHE